METEQLNLGYDLLEGPLGGFQNVCVVQRDGCRTIASLLELPFPDSSMKKIRCSNAIQYMTADESARFVRECLRVLKRGGFLEVVVPALDVVVSTYWILQHQESIEVSNDPIRPLDWLEREVLISSLGDRFPVKQAFHKDKLLRMFRRCSLHNFEGYDRWCIKMLCQKADAPACSVVLSTRDKAEYLDRTLASIFSQQVPFPYDVIVVDDGSTDNTKDVCRKYDVDYIYVHNTRYRNPSAARNVGYRAARGRIILAQSDDVIHRSPNMIEYMVGNLKKGEFLLAQTHNYRYVNGQPREFIMEYCGPRTRRPYFFLGAVWREDLYAIGGCDEEFVEPCYDDNWFADCLIRGRKLSVRYTDEVLAHHQSHPHGPHTHDRENLSRELYAKKVQDAERTGVFISSGGAWSGASVQASSAGPEAPKARRPRAQSPPGQIPQRMNFFWAGDSLSWMRYMTLVSFRRYNPDWEMVLYRLAKGGQKRWDTAETQDSMTYTGPNYLSSVDSLGVEVVEWEPPMPDLAPAHACDLFQWQELHEYGGFYADMDILWVAPFPYAAVCGQDAVFCLSDGFMAIGLVGAMPNCRVMKHISAIARINYSPTRYQSTGAEAVYRMAGIWPNWSAANMPGEQALASLKQRYPQYRFGELPPETVYSWNYTSTDRIFSETNQAPEVASESIGSAETH